MPIVATLAQITNPADLRKLADWYRKQADLAGNSRIWDGRLRTAEALDEKAIELELQPTQGSARQRPLDESEKAGLPNRSSRSECTN